MPRPPLISILIPVYNRESCIGHCLRSAIDQRWANLEIVVSDNHSTDRTWAICQEMAIREPRIRLLRNESNTGPVRNWRKCLDAARGSIGMLLFSDDALMPNFEEQTAPFLDDPDIGFVFTAVRHGSEPGTARVLYEWHGRAGKISSRCYLRDAMIHNGTLPCSPGAALFRLADLRRHLVTRIPSPSVSGFEEHGAGPDLLLLLRTAAAYPTVAHIAEPLAFFRDHPESISRTRSMLLDSAYAQARIWFAAAQSDQRWLNRAFGAYWAQRMKTTGRWIDPVSLAAQFLAAGMPRPNYCSALRQGIGHWCSCRINGLKQGFEEKCAGQRLTPQGPQWADSS